MTFGTLAVGRVKVEVDCDLVISEDGGLLIRTEQTLSPFIPPDASERLAISILTARGWKIERIGTQTRAYAPEPESKQYPSKDIKPEE